MSDEKHVVQLWHAKDGWRWRKVALRGNLPDETVSESGEAYGEKGDALLAAARENPSERIQILDPELD